MLAYGIATIVVVRFGLVVLALGIFTVNVVLRVPLTLHLSAWYSGSTAFVLLTLLALAAWGFYTSLAGRRLWSEELFEE